MSLFWSDYCRWAHESGTRKSGPGVPDAERAALMHIWGLGLGGEALEFLTEVLDWNETVPGSVMGSVNDVVRTGVSPKALLENGDILFYIARLYVDTGNERRCGVEAGQPPSLRNVCRHLGAVVECMKKAFRSEGESGLLRFCRHEGDVCGHRGVEDSVCCRRDEHPHGSEDSWVWRPGRREEFGVLLDAALGAIEAWLVSRGSSLSAACEANVEKLVARRKAGLISAQGERVSELGRAVRPEDVVRETLSVVPSDLLPEASTHVNGAEETQDELQAVIADRCKKCREKGVKARGLCLKCYAGSLVENSTFCFHSRPSDPVKEARLERADLQSRTLPRPPEGQPEIPNPKRSG